MDKPDFIEPPWIAVHLATHSEVRKYNDHEPHEGCSGHLIIVKVIGNPNIRKANAELIAGAPDLLKALKTLAPAECPIVTHHSENCGFCFAIKTIARVEGKAAPPA